MYRNYSCLAYFHQQMGREGDGGNRRFKGKVPIPCGWNLSAITDADWHTWFVRWVVVSEFNQNFAHVPDLSIRNLTSIEFTLWFIITRVDHCCVRLR